VTAVNPTPSSEPHPAAAPAGSAPAVIALEGMPGAGKTTAAHALRRAGHPVLGEYVDHQGASLDIAAHPDVTDDRGHQTNWLLKHAHLEHAHLAGLTGGVVFLDRDWLSALAYAYSLPTPTAIELLMFRTGWAANHLRNGQLAIADTYLIFDLPVADSLRRRAYRLTAGHPWSSPYGLARLRRFYQDPPAAVCHVHPDLAERMRTATWRRVSGLSRGQTLDLLRELATAR
jgi:hypothetical protein